MVRLAEAALYTSLAPPGTKACDAGGGAFRPEWREGPVRTRCPGAISCGPGALLRVARLSGLETRFRGDIELLARYLGKMQLEPIIRLRKSVGSTSRAAGSYKPR